MKTAVLGLKPVPPFRLDLTVWTLRRRQENLIDRWDGETYRRVVVSDRGKPFEIAVTQDGTPANPQLQIELIGASGAAAQRQALQTVERMLGVYTDLSPFYRTASKDKQLGPLAKTFKGMKPPRIHSPFESLINAISCQQITLTLGIRLLNTLARRYAPSFTHDGEIYYAFPRPEDLAGVDIEELRAMKFSYQKARYITGLSQAIVEGRVDLDAIAKLDDQEAVERLREIKGIGRWTAEYFLLRAAGRTHIFPGDDVGARNHLERWLGKRDKMDYDDVQRSLRVWRSYGGLIYFHLLLKSLAEKSIVHV